MRIFFAIGARLSAPPAAKRLLVCAGALASVLAVAACSKNEAAAPESRLGAKSADADYRWNGNPKRSAYDSKNLDGLGGSGAGRDAGAPGDTVLFTSDSAELSADAKALLDRLAADLRLKPVRALAIEGHADERGTREYNLALGARRAAAVKSYLIAKGMLESQVRTTSFGKERPVATCDDISCWAKNRRAQVVVASK